MQPEYIEPRIDMLQPDSVQVATEALNAFKAGYHCAESVSLAVVRHFGDPDFSPRIATAFGAGIGRTMTELCGAFTGGVIAIGVLFGRDNPGDPLWKDQVAPLTAQWRELFLQEFKTLSCPTLLVRFGEQDDFMDCKSLASRAAGLLAELIVSHQDNSGKYEPQGNTHA